MAQKTQTLAVGLGPRGWGTEACVPPYLPGNPAPLTLHSAVRERWEGTQPIENIKGYQMHAVHSLSSYLVMVMCLENV